MQDFPAISLTPAHAHTQDSNRPQPGRGVGALRKMRPRPCLPVSPATFKPAKDPLYILIACEESQAECLAFRALGHYAFSADLQSARYFPEWHIMGDVRALLKGKRHFLNENYEQIKVPGWDLIIAHPPCTYLCRLAGCLLKVHGVMNWQRLRGLILGRRFFFECLAAKAHYVAVENPVPMKRAQLPPISCYADPSWFGVKYTKKTCYWLKNLPPLMPTIQHPKPKCYVQSSRGKYRSRTFPEVAAAIAQQWSEFILANKQCSGY